MSKGAINRLGERLIAGPRIAPVDLEELAVILDAYQQVLDDVKAQLRDLGFPATARVKTTGTLTDKLRRIHGFELSRMQDVAGARIVVDDVGTQDGAAAKIKEFYESRGCTCRPVDRRKDPRFGYRAMHLVVRVDGTLVEIQIRTQLQDAWAQMFERLADRWGRGIRYGESPENPTIRLTDRSGLAGATRSEVVGILMQLSHAISGIEDAQLTTIENKLGLANLSQLMAIWKAAGLDEQGRSADRIESDYIPARDAILHVLSQMPEETPALLISAGNDMTNEQLLQLAQLCHDRLSALVSARVVSEKDLGERLRGILRTVADATNDGE